MWQAQPLIQGECLIIFGFFSDPPDLIIKTSPFTNFQFTENWNFQKQRIQRNSAYLGYDLVHET